MYRRAFDVCVSALLVLIALPIVLLAATGSALTLRAWPFFSQGRIGLAGERFRFLKVRTLHPDVPGYIDKHQLDTSQIPPFCRLLRQLHLDELPQLLLVLQGKMSLVGPRPEMGYLHRRMPTAFAELRTSVRPGCTGLWQVSVASSELISESPRYDCFYLAHRTLRLDLWVLYRTVLNMLGVGRLITLDDVPSWTLRGTRDEAIDLRRTVGDVIDLTDRRSEAALSFPTSAAR